MDVARAAGVDRSTVSRILNRSFGQHRYAPETIRAVEAAASELEYRPSTTAQALRTGKTRLVGLLVGDIANSFFGQLTAAIEAGLRPHDYRLMIGSTSEDLAVQRSYLAEMLHRGVDGIIISPAGAAGLRAAASAGTPVILIDRPLARTNWPYVGIDNHEAGRVLGDHLRRLGYRKIGVVLPEGGDDPTLRWRLQGLKAGLGPGGGVAWRHLVPLRSGTGERLPLARRLTASEPPPDALVGLTNDCTVTAMEALRHVGWRVPQRIGLAGIDDFRAAELLDPPLTVVSQPIHDIAASAVDYLLAAMAGRPEPARRLLAPRLIERQSLRALVQQKEHH